VNGLGAIMNMWNPLRSARLHSFAEGFCKLWILGRMYVAIRNHLFCALYVLHSLSHGLKRPLGIRFGNGISYSEPSPQEQNWCQTKRCYASLFSWIIHQEWLLYRHNIIPLM
jgi:hypothetical protein